MYKAKRKEDSSSFVLLVLSAGMLSSLIHSAAFAYDVSIGEEYIRFRAVGKTVRFASII